MLCVYKHILSKMHSLFLGNELYAYTHFFERETSLKSSELLMPSNSSSSVLFVQGSCLYIDSKCIFSAASVNRTEVHDIRLSKVKH